MEVLKPMSTSEKHSGLQCFRPTEEVKPQPHLSRARFREVAEPSSGPSANAGSVCRNVPIVPPLCSQPDDCSRSEPVPTEMDYI